MTELGVVNKVLLRVNANTKTPTCKELEGQKKRMHLASFQYLLDRLEKDLKERAAASDAEERKKEDYSASGPEKGLVTTIMEKCKYVYDAHEAMSAELYFEEANYRSIVAESLDVIAMGQNTFRLWLRGSMPALLVKMASLLECHRSWTAYQKKQLKLCPEEDRVKVAQELCRNIGLIRNSVNERSIFGETPLLTAAANGAR